MPFMSAIDVGNDTRPVPPRGGKEPGRKQFIEKRNPTPVSGRAVHASGYSGGKSIIIPSGQLFAWQSAGGGTRDQIYGRWARLYIALGVGLEIDVERTYRSGYPGFTGRGVACHGFPFWFWSMVMWGSDGKQCNPFSLPIVAALDLQVQDSNKPVFLLPSPTSHSWPILVAPSSNLGKPNPFKSHQTLSLVWYAIRPLGERVLINQKETRLKGHPPLLRPISLLRRRDPLTSPQANWRR